jgi:hypothetical protein
VINGWIAAEYLGQTALIRQGDDISRDEVSQAGQEHYEA